MANGYFERGEIYNVRMDYGVGSEEGSYRPGVIVSSAAGNNTSATVIVAYLTKQVRNLSVTMETYATGQRSYILGSQIVTVDKGRLKSTPMGKLTPAEVRKLDGILEEVFDLGYVDDTALAEKDKEIEELKAKIAELTGEVAREQTKVIEQKAKHEDELLSYKVENAMWQKCYERSLDQLVKMKVGGDLERRRKEEPVIVPVDPPKQPEPEKQPEAKIDLVDINSATETALKKIGFSAPLAKATVKARPFESVEDLKKVPGMAKTKYQILAPKVKVVPVEPEAEDPVEEPNVEPNAEPGEKVNINFVLGRELHEATGVALSTAYTITGYRRQHGAFESLDDLLKIPRIFPGTVDKLRDKVYCGPYEGERSGAPGNHDYYKEMEFEPYTGEKININTATVQEIHDKTGLTKTVCYSIVGCRKRDGLYKSVEDLENVPRFTEYHMKKYGPMFEV